MNRLNRWLLRRFHITLNFPIERAKIRLKLKLYLDLEGDGEPIYLKEYESGILDNYGKKKSDSNLYNTKAAMIIDGKHVSIRNFTFIGHNNEPPESFKVE